MTSRSSCGWFQMMVRSRRLSHRDGLVPVLPGCQNGIEDAHRLDRLSGTWSPPSCPRDVHKQTDTDDHRRSSAELDSSQNSCKSPGQSTYPTESAIGVSVMSFFFTRQRSAVRVCHRPLKPLFRGVVDVWRFALSHRASHLLHGRVRIQRSWPDAVAPLGRVGVLPLL